LITQITDGGRIDFGNDGCSRGKGWRQIGAVGVVLDEGLHRVWGQGDFNGRLAVEGEHHGLEIAQNHQGLSLALQSAEAFQAPHH
jgi:hypothetical protein